MRVYVCTNVCMCVCIYLYIKGHINGLMAYANGSRDYAHDV